MALPGVKLEVKDGALGTLGNSAEGSFAAIGVSSTHGGGVKSFSDPDNLKSIGYGPLRDVLASALSISGAKAYVVALEGTVAGTVSQVSAGNGNKGVGSLTVAGNPRNEYKITIDILSRGGLNDAAFRHTVDGVKSGEFTVPATPGTYAIPNTGLTLTFAPGAPVGDAVSYEKGDTFAFTTTAPSASSAEILAAVDTLIEAKLPIEGIVITGITGAALRASLAVKRQSAFDKAQYLYIITQARYRAAGETTDQWVNLLAGDERGTTSDVGLACVAAYGTESDIYGAVDRRGMLGLIVGMTVRRKVHEPPDAVRFDAIPGVTKILPDDLNDAHIERLKNVGYITIRKIPGLKGIYITSAVLMSTAGSDYEHIERIRVMNKACRLVHKQQTAFINDTVAIGTDGSPIGLNLFRTHSQAALDQMAIDGEISSGEVIIPPGQNLLATKKIRTKIRIVPLGKMEIIETEIAYRNPKSEASP